VEIATPTAAPSFSKDVQLLLEGTASVFGDATVTLVHVLWVFSEALRGPRSIQRGTTILDAATKLVNCGLLRSDIASQISIRFALTETGNRFLLRLRVERNAAAAEKYLYPDAARGPITA